MTSQFGGGGAGLPVGGVLSGSLPNPAFSTNGTTPLMGDVSVSLSAIVTNTPATSMTTILTLPLTAGRWLLIAELNFQNTAAGQAWCASRLYDGATEIATGYANIAASSASHIPLVGAYAAAGAISVLLQAYFSSATNVVNSVNPAPGAGTTLTRISALRIA